MKKLFSLLLVLGISSLVAHDLKFCVTPTDKPTQLIKQFYPLIYHIEKKTNNEIKIKIASTYENIIEDIASGECDFSRVGPASYILAKEKNNDIKLLVMEHKKGKKTFNGVIVVPTDSPITKLEELKGKTFAFGSATSTIGRYLSQEQLLKAGIHSKDLKSFKYLNRHDKVAMAVALKLYDGGAIKESTFKKYEKKGLRVISTFKNITKPWIASPQMTNETFKTIKDTLLKVKDAKLLKAVKKSGFLPSSDKEYEFVRQGMKASQNF